jgi:hypothetical protein
MNISSLSSVSSINPTSGVSSVAATQTSQTTQSSDIRKGDGTHLSKLGELFSKLQDLESSDPAKAKQVLSSIASTLSEKANSPDNRDPHLQELADKFTQAAQTGDLSALKPKGGGHGHRPEGPPPGPPPDGGADSTSTSATSDATSSTTASTTASSTTDATTAGAASKAASYAQNRNHTRVDLESIISNALSGVTA